jgi:hypothetical protein
MNAAFLHRTVCCLMLVALGLTCLPLFASPAFAADASVEVPTLQANLVYEFASDRGRMIQVSLVIVALGCALIWWYR